MNKLKKSTLIIRTHGSETHRSKKIRNSNYRIEPKNGLMGGMVPSYRYTGLTS